MTDSDNTVTHAPTPTMRALDPATRRIMEAWIAREPAREIPWCPLPRPLPEATVALVSSAAVALATDQPFDQDGERRNPWWGDPSFRVIPRELPRGGASADRPPHPRAPVALPAAAPRGDPGLMRWLLALALPLAAPAGSADDRGYWEAVERYRRASTRRPCGT